MARITALDVIRLICDYLPLDDYSSCPESVCTRWRAAVHGHRLRYRCAPPGVCELMPRLLSHMMEYAGSAAYVS
jgi:hypothetical protein